MFNRPGGRSKGVTLIEMMIVVVLLAILSALAAPSLFELIIRNRLDTTINEFMTTLSLARSEAIRRGTNVVIRRAAGSTSQEWTKGWEVFVDLPAGGSPNVRDAGEELIRSGQPLSSPLTLYGSRGNAEDFLAFAPSGRIAGGANTFIFALCYSGQIAISGRSRSRAVIANDAGGMRLASTASNCTEP